MAKAKAVVPPRLPAPDVNDLVRVTIGVPGDDDDEETEAIASEVASRVEDVIKDSRDRPSLYTIAAPWFAGDAEQPPPGTVCSLQWPTERGLCTLPVVLLAEGSNPRGLRMWTVKVTGPVQRRERRRYVR